MWLSNTSEQADAGTPLGINLGHGRPDARDVGGAPPVISACARHIPTRDGPFDCFERIIELGGSGDPAEIRGLETGSSRAAAWDARFHGMSPLAGTHHYRSSKQGTRSFNSDFGQIMLLMCDLAKPLSSLGL